MLTEVTRDSAGRQGGVPRSHGKQWNRGEGDLPGQRVPRMSRNPAGHCRLWRPRIPLRYGLLSLRCPLERRVGRHGIRVPRKQHRTSRGVCARGMGGMAPCSSWISGRAHLLTLSLHEQTPPPPAAANGCAPWGLLPGRRSAAAGGGAGPGSWAPEPERRDRSRGRSFRIRWAVYRDPRENGDERPSPSLRCLAASPRGGAGHPESLGVAKV